MSMRAKQRRMEGLTVADENLWQREGAGGEEDHKAMGGGHFLGDESVMTSGNPLGIGHLRIMRPQNIYLQRWLPLNQVSIDSSPSAPARCPGRYFPLVTCQVPCSPGHVNDSKGQVECPLFT